MLVHTQEQIEALRHKMNDLEDRIKTRYKFLENKDLCATADSDRPVLSLHLPYGHGVVDWNAGTVIRNTDKQMRDFYAFLELKEKHKKATIPETRIDSTSFEKILEETEIIIQETDRVRNIAFLNFDLFLSVRNFIDKNIKQRNNFVTLEIKYLYYEHSEL